MNKHQYVVMVDAINLNADNIPTDVLAVMGYNTGTPDIRWQTSTYQRFTKAGILTVDQEPGLPSFKQCGSDVADIESGAATILDFINACPSRIASGFLCTAYIDYALWSALETAVQNENIMEHVRFGIANYNFNAEDATALMEQFENVMFVQFASPSTNPGTLLPGSVLTLSEAQCDLSIKRADFFPAPGIAGIAWKETY